MKNILPGVVFIALFFLSFTARGAEFINLYCGSETLYSPIYHPSYDLSFSLPYVVSGSDYVLCPRNTMHIGNVKSYIAICGDGRENVLAHSLVAWVYQGTVKQKTSYNYFGPSQSINRGEVIGPSSQNYGLHIYGATPQGGSMDVYTFNNPGDYFVYLDYIKTICGTSPDIPFVIACPWLGGIRRNDMCRNAEGWVPQRTFSIKVPGPALSITAPSPLSGAPGSSYLLTWVIRNTGIGTAVYSATPVCPGFSCSFVGYTAGTGIVLPQGGSYSLVMRLNVLDTSPSGNAGVRVNYDDAYGLSCIAPATRESYVWVTVPIVTTSTTTTTSSTTTTTFPFPKTVTFLYKVVDDHAVASCSIWTDIPGSWKVNQSSSSIVNGGVNLFTIRNIFPGTYRWNVTCVDNVGQPSSVMNAPQGYWTFTIDNQ